LLITGIIGYPLKITLSPPMHNAAFKALGINGIYVPLSVKEKHLKDAVDGLKALGFKGFNVTIPYKKKVIEYLDEFAEEAGKVDAVNTVLLKNKKLKGYNTDVYGFDKSLSHYKIKIKNKKVILIGAGGVGAACSYVINKKKPSRFMITDTIDKKSKELARIYEAENIPLKEIRKLILESDLVLNATPIDLQDKVLPLMKEDSTYYDINYKFKLKEKKGVKVVNGGLMLVLQGARAFTLWTKREAPVEIMKRAAGFEI
jgi:shikimate dehydrogenase